MQKLLSSLLFIACASLAADPAPEFKGGFERLDPGFDRLIAPDAKIEVLATGFNWSEGPVWKDGQILFSDVPENTVFSWKEGNAQAGVFLKPSGNFSGDGQGSNGLATDAGGNLVLCQHGERRVARQEKDGSFTVLADHHKGKRFNSPNDLVISGNGTVFFTDPPYGLKKGVEPDVPFHGVYAVHPDAPNQTFLLIEDIRWPNGIALSPDEKTLYIAVSDKEASRILAYDLTRIAGMVHGTVIPKAESGRVVFNAQPLKSAGRKGGCDGMKVDALGNLWLTGPGGVLVVSPEGRHLGTILTGQNTGNCAWGGKDKDTMYITADMFLLRVKTQVRGL